MDDAARFEVDAVCQAGVFRTLEFPKLPEGARVHLVIEAPPAAGPDLLELAGSVYDGLAPSELAEIEAIVVDRSRFLGR